MTESVDNLFRDDVFKGREDQWLGGIRIVPPKLGWYFCALAMIGLAMVAIFACLANVTQHERVSGMLVPSQGISDVTPRTAGSIVKIFVSDGDRVDAGQDLVEISGDQSSASLGDTRASIAEQLKSKEAKLSSDSDELTTLTKLQQNALEGRLGVLRNQVSAMQEEVELQNQRLNSSAELYEQLAKAGTTGVVSKLQILQEHDTLLTNKAQAKEAHRQLLDLQQQELDVQAQLEQLPTVTLEKRNELSRELSDVSASLSENEALRAIRLRAQTSGTVTNLVVHAGEQVSSGQLLLQILPVGSELEAEVWAPAESVGSISVGQSVVLRYAAFPYQKFGQYAGRVRQIAQNAFSSQEVSRLSGRETKDPQFRVLIDVDDQYVSAFGRRTALIPGMEVTADIILATRHPIDWVIEPLRSSKISAHGPDRHTGASGNLN